MYRLLLQYVCNVSPTCQASSEPSTQSEFCLPQSLSSTGKRYWDGGQYSSPSSENQIIQEVQQCPHIQSDVMSCEYHLVLAMTWLIHTFFVNVIIKFCSCIHTVTAGHQLTTHSDPWQWGIQFLNLGKKSTGISRYPELRYQNLNAERKSQSVAKQGFTALFYGSGWVWSEVSSIAPNIEKLVLCNW